MAKVLGLDMGHSSIGWALVDDANQQIIDIGVRIFPAGVENYGQGEKEQSLATQRRIKRGERVQTRRRALRKRQVRTWLKRHGCWPETEQAYHFEFKVMNPYQLRAKAVNESLTKLELGRVIFHLAHHRGFKSNSTGPSKEGKALYKGLNDIKGLDETEAKWQESGLPTLGAYLNTLNEVNQKVRSRYTLRAWYEAEFDAIMAFQLPYHKEWLTAEIVQAIKDIVYFQRPLKDQSDLIGECTLEAGEKRAKLSHPVSQIFAVYDQINKLKVWEKGQKQPDAPNLNRENRDRLYEALLTTEALTLDKLPKILKMDALKKEYKTNLDTQKKIKGFVFGAEVTKKLKMKDLSFDDFKILYTHLVQGEEHFIDFIAKSGFKGITVEQAKELLDVSLPKGYAKLSIKAMEKILSVMADSGEVYSDAVTTAGYISHSFTGEEVDPYPIKRKYLPVPPLVRNPVVDTALWELRRVINSIVSHYGKPDRIHVELARDIKQSAEERQKRTKIRQDNEDRNLKYVAEAKGEKISLVLDTVGKRLKYRLWKEQGERCLYSGQPIGIEQLFQSTSVQIDHILPLSRTRLDNPNNKALVFAKENADKGDKTPYEWLFNVDPPKYERILEAVQKMDAEFSTKKASKFSAETLKNVPELDGFISQNLNDTRYMTRVARRYLARIMPWGMIQGSNGTYTSTLRNEWFQNQKNADGTTKWFIENPILNDVNLHPSELANGGKNRLDHRHHALDAVVIALTTNHRIKAIKKSKATNLSLDDKTRSLPWPDLIKQVKLMLARTIVSFRVKDKVNGPLHNETIYGKIQIPDNGKYSFYLDPLKRLVLKKGSKIISMDELKQSFQSDIQTKIINAALKLSGDKSWKGILDNKFPVLTKKDKVEQSILNGVKPLGTIDVLFSFDGVSETYVVKKKLGSLTEKMVKDIVDLEVRQLVINEIRVLANKPDWTPNEKLPKVKLTEIKHSNGNPIRSVRVAFNEKPKAIRNYRRDQNGNPDPVYVLPESNHHTAIFVDEMGKRHLNIGKYLDVSERSKIGKPIVYSELPNQELLVFFIANQLLIHGLEDDFDWTNKDEYKNIFQNTYRFVKFAGSFIFKHHSLSKTRLQLLGVNGEGVDDIEATGRKTMTANTFIGRKVSIDPAGFLKPTR